jgi:hypothetical protein
VNKNNELILIYYIYSKYLLIDWNTVINLDDEIEKWKNDNKLNEEYIYMIYFCFFAVKNK